MENKKLTSESKIPFISDIPLLGNLFKRKIKSSVKTELMIFLTPYIVANPTQLASLSALERSRSMTATNSFSQQELNRFLDQLPDKTDARTGKDRK